MSWDTDLLERLQKLRLETSEFEESFSRSAGPGGQNVNKVSTSVLLKHLPTELTVQVQDSRSQAVNRRLARERLLDKIERQRKRKVAERRAKQALARRKRRKRTAGEKKRIREFKEHRTSTKERRKKVKNF